MKSIEKALSESLPHWWHVAVPLAVAFTLRGQSSIPRVIRRVPLLVLCEVGRWYAVALLRGYGGAPPCKRSGADPVLSSSRSLGDGRETEPSNTADTASRLDKQMAVSQVQA
jgi:hypothetical protein